MAKNSLAHFVEYLDLGFVPARHHKLLIDHLEAVERGDIRKLMVFMPPGSAKSTYSSVLLPPWFLGRNPSASVLAVSNALELAERFSRRARNIVASEAFKNVFGFGVSPDSRAASSWALERGGGEFFAAGVGTAIAGRRADLGLVDDPVRNRAEADSETVRESTYQWYTNDFVTRLKPGARQVIIQTRWHEDDLSGRILSRDANDWNVLSLPMEAEDNDPLGRVPGERLWPDWFTDDMVAEAKRDAMLWASLYQQRPAPLEGAYFKRDWFPLWHRVPEGLKIYGASDFAVSEGGGDWTEHGVFGIDHQGIVYVLDWWRGQTTPDKWIESLLDLAVKWEVVTWFGEGGVIRRAVEFFLTKRMRERGVNMRVEWLASTQDKPARARAIQGLASRGDVQLPAKAAWMADVMPQLLMFPNGKHDDAVDVFSLMGRAFEFARPPKNKKPAKLEPQVRLGPSSWMG